MEKMWNLGKIKSYALAVCAAMLLFGGYSQRSDAAECLSTGTLADLEGITCTIDDKTLSNLSVLGDLEASDVNYQLVIGPPFWGLEYQFSLTVIDQGELDWSLSFQLDCTDGTDCIDSVHGQFTGGATAGGAATVAETYCPEGTNCVNVFLTQAASSFTVDIAPVSFITLTKDHNVICQQAGCVASISNVQNTVDQTVPEPASLALLGTGLFALGWFRRRRDTRV